MAAKKNQGSIAIAWGYEDEDGLLQYFTEFKKPRKRGLGYSSAWLAPGYTPVKVVVIRAKAFDALLKKKRSQSQRAGGENG